MYGLVNYLIYDRVTYVNTIVLIVLEHMLGLHEAVMAGDITAFGNQSVEPEAGIGMTGRDAEAVRPSVQRQRMGY